MSKLRRHDWRTHRNIDCNICGKNLKSSQEKGEHRKTEHKMDKKIKCKCYPDCIDGNECFFIHGTELAENVQKRSKYCPSGETCQNQSCEYNEMNQRNMNLIPCRFQEKCNRSNCSFKHIVEKAFFLVKCAQNSKSWYNIKLEVEI